MPVCLFTLVFCFILYFCLFCFRDFVATGFKEWQVGIGKRSFESENRAHLAEKYAIIYGAVTSLPLREYSHAAGNVTSKVDTLTRPTHMILLC